MFLEPPGSAVYRKTVQRTYIFFLPYSYSYLFTRTQARVDSARSVSSGGFGAGDGAIIPTRNRGKAGQNDPHCTRGSREKRAEVFQHGHHVTLATT